MNVKTDLISLRSTRTCISFVSFKFSHLMCSIICTRFMWPSGTFSIVFLPTHQGWDWNKTPEISGLKKISRDWAERKHKLFTINTFLCGQSIITAVHSPRKYCNHPRRSSFGNPRQCRRIQIFQMRRTVRKSVYTATGDGYDWLEVKLWFKYAETSLPVILW